MSQDIDPLEELYEVKDALAKKYRTVAAYTAHLRRQPALEEIIARLEKKVERGAAKKNAGKRGRNMEKSTRS